MQRLLLLRAVSGPVLLYIHLLSSVTSSCVKSVAHAPHAGGVQYLQDRVVTHGCTHSHCRGNGLQHCVCLQCVPMRREVHVSVLLARLCSACDPPSALPSILSCHPLRSPSNSSSRQAALLVPPSPLTPLCLPPGLLILLCSGSSTLLVSPSPPLPLRSSPQVCASCYTRAMLMRLYPPWARATG